MNSTTVYICVCSHCENNAGLYTALNLDIVFNITGQTEQLVKIPRYIFYAYC